MISAPSFIGNVLLSGSKSDLHLLPTRLAHSHSRRSTTRV